jgi:hypothetical protein
MAVLSSRILHRALLAEGFEIPKACHDIRVIVSVNGAVGLQFDCYFDHEEIIKFGAALQKAGQQATQGARAKASEPPS